MDTKELKEVVAACIRATKARSNWENGVKDYALELLENIEPNTDTSDICNRKLLAKKLLNGASDWQEYSYGGCALIYNTDIAARLCNPTEYKRVKHGLRNPNGRENWLDSQARALYQACNLVITIALDYLDYEND